MTYTEAVELAKKGEQQGFGFLYQRTYKSKLHLALQYMKNIEDAKDVLRDSYVKAFSSLDTLQNPERFSAWFGQIVANTAKNALVKKNPVLFSDIASDTNDDPFEFRIEDYDFSRQPEISYTKEETRQIVHEMLDSLSPEQKICILMFHFEGTSIKEIASALNCSENTVKSRLNYGRKNIKLKAEALQKKGCKLYGLAPLTLLVLLLRKDAYAMSAEPAFIAAASEIEKNVLKGKIILGKGTKSAGSRKAAKKGAKKSAEQAFSGSAAETAAGHSVGASLLHTAAGKVIIGIIGAAVIGGAAVGTAQLIRNGTDTVSQEEAAAEVSDEPETHIIAETPDEEEAKDTVPEAVEETVKPVTLTENDYPTLIKGALTKKETEFILAYGPAWRSGEMKKEDLTDKDYLYIVNIFGQIADYEGSEYYGLLTYGMDSSYHRWHLKNEINRLFSSFTDFQFSESSTVPGIDVDSKYVWDWPAELNFSSSANITNAVYLDDEIIIYYDYYKQKFDGVYEEIIDGKKAAVLRKTDNGTFQIVLITDASEVNMEEEFGLKSASEGDDNSDISDTGETAGLR